MEPTDLTVKLLQEIRDGVRQTNERIDTMNSQFGQRLEVMSEQFGQRLEVMSEQFGQRFEVIETTLRDLAEQMVMLARGVKTAVETRGRLDDRLEDHERRIAELEKRPPH